MGSTAYCSMLAARSAIVCKDAGSEISFANALRASVVCWPSRIISRAAAGAALGGIGALRDFNTKYQRRPPSKRYLPFQFPVGAPNTVTVIVLARGGKPARLHS